MTESSLQIRTYWKEYFDQNALRFAYDPLKQIGKTVLGESVALEQLDLILLQIKNNLELCSNSILADIGCGNALLTKMLAGSVREIHGFDFSRALIESAQLGHLPNNAVLHVADIFELNHSDLAKFTHVLLYEVIQHLSAELLARLLDALNKSSTVSEIFIGGIPDADRINDFYNTTEKMKFYERTVENDLPHIGTWWCKRDLLDLAKLYGFEGFLVDQDPELYTSYYRYDCVLRRTII